MPSLLSLNHYEAREYFLKGSNYVNFDLPDYFSFDELLDKVSLYMNGRQLSDFFAVDPSNPSQKLLPSAYEDANYHLIGNKDGEFAWRPFEIIHPVLYVALMNELTSESNWLQIQRRFGEYQESAVSCESIPFKSDDELKDKAHQIQLWWTNVEQASLRLSLKYQYIFDGDIADCYGSIYTHAIAWAMHGKDVAKARRSDYSLLGNKIDLLIRNMRFGQTNGIPQGSTIMDFIAEILLGYIDVLLTDELDKQRVERTNYTIIRYRDDYKILTNYPELGRNIVKCLSVILSRHGMKLNAQKTKLQNDPVMASVKPDKFSELMIPRNRMSMSKWLFQIYAAIKEYPNSGLATRQLNNYYKSIERLKKLGKYDDPKVMIAIITNLALSNPKTYQYCMAILSKLLTFCKESEQVQILQDIQTKFDLIPNTGLLDIWLQRISYGTFPSVTYKEKLTRVVAGDYLTNIIWSSAWLEQGLRRIVSSTSFISGEKIEELPQVISPREVMLFSYRY